MSLFGKSARFSRGSTSPEEQESFFPRPSSTLHIVAMAKKTATLEKKKTSLSKKNEEIIAASASDAVVAGGRKTRYVTCLSWA